MDSVQAIDISREMVGKTFTGNRRLQGNKAK